MLGLISTIFGFVFIWLSRKHEAEAERIRTASSTVKATISRIEDKKGMRLILYVTFGEHGEQRCEYGTFDVANYKVGNPIDIMYTKSKQGLRVWARDDPPEWVYSPTGARVFKMVGTGFLIYGVSNLLLTAMALGMLLGVTLPD